MAVWINGKLDRHGAFLDDPALLLDDDLECCARCGCEQRQHDEDSTIPGVCRGFEYTDEPPLDVPPTKGGALG
jgi:hypothetical protein